VDVPEVLRKSEGKSKIFGREIDLDVNNGSLVNIEILKTDI
jgi:hypothetical protein